MGGCISPNKSLFRMKDTVYCVSITLCCFVVYSTRRFRLRRIHSLGPNYFFLFSIDTFILDKVLMDRGIMSLFIYVFS